MFFCDHEGAWPLLSDVIKNWVYYVLYEQEILICTSSLAPQKPLKWILERAWQQLVFVCFDCKNITNFLKEAKIEKGWYVTNNKKILIKAF